MWMVLQFALATAAAIVLGASTGAERFLLIGVILGASAVLLSALSWRRHLIPLVFVAVCLEGFLSLRFRGQYQTSLLLKDFVLMVAYTGFLAELVMLKRFLFFRTILIPMGVLFLLAATEIFNPALPSLVVGLVGFKILCFYMPLTFLGYYCFNSLDDLQRFIRFMMIVSLPIIALATWQYVVGVEALTVFGEGFGIAVIETPPSAYGQHLRALGTFSSPDMLAWFGYFMVALGVTYVGIAKTFRQKAWGLLCLVLAFMSVLMSGTRGGIIGTSAVTFMALLLMRRHKELLGAILLGLAAVCLMALLLGEAVLGRLETLLSAETYYQRLSGPIEQAMNILARTPLGWGMGCASQGARHVMSAGQIIQFVENYPAKLAYEMGWPGLLAFIWVVGAVIVQGFRSYRQSRTPETRWVAGCLGIYLAGVLLLLVEGTALDKLPANVFSWFLLGTLLRIPELSWQTSTPAAAQAPPHLYERPPRQA
jgi:hypothetical protein